LKKRREKKKGEAFLNVFQRGGGRRKRQSQLEAREKKDSRGKFYNRRKGVKEKEVCQKKEGFPAKGKRKGDDNAEGEHTASIIVPKS